jgi:hypothetical protein
MVKGKLPTSQALSERRFALSAVCFALRLVIIWVIREGVALHLFLPMRNRATNGASEVAHLHWPRLRNEDDTPSTLAEVTGDDREQGKREAVVPLSEDRYSEVWVSYVHHDESRGSACPLHD